MRPRGGCGPFNLLCWGRGAGLALAVAEQLVDQQHFTVVFVLADQDHADESAAAVRLWSERAAARQVGLATSRGPDPPRKHKPLTEPECSRLPQGGWCEKDGRAVLRPELFSSRPAATSTTTAQRVPKYETDTAVLQTLFLLEHLSTRSKTRHSDNVAHYLDKNQYQICLDIMRRCVLLTLWGGKCRTCICRFSSPLIVY